MQQSFNWQGGFFLSTFFFIFVSLLYGLSDIGGLILFNAIIYWGASRVSQNLKTIHNIRTSGIFTLAILLSIVMFFLGWYKDLMASDYLAAYDPARYYHMARLSVTSGLSILSFNYVGIVYFYKFLFTVFGINPLIAIPLNTFLIYISIYYLIRLYRNIVGDNFSKKVSKGIIIAMFFVPELLWYNCLSSREIICLACVTISISVIYELFAFKVGLKNIITLFIAISVLGVIRTSLLIMVVLVMLYSIVFFGKKLNKTSLVLITCVSLGVLTLAPMISMMLGSSEFSYVTSIESTASTENADTSGFTWTDNSIGRMLIADSFQELILLSPIRIIAYIIAPFPQISVNFTNLVNQFFGEWQHLWCLLSVVFYFVSIPSLIRLLIHSFKNLQSRYVLFLLLIVFFVISCGVSFIHDRYRITGVPFLLLAIFYARSINAYKVLSRRIFFFMLAIALFGVFFIKFS